MVGLAGETANLIVALKLDDSGFTGKLNSATRALKGMDRGLSQMGRGVGQISSGVGKIVDRMALAGAAAGAFVVTTAASFEQTEAGIRKTVAGSTEEVDALIDKVRQMAKDIPLSFEELGAIAAEGGALGISTEGLDEFTEVVARLAVSTDLTTEQASAALGQLSNVLGLSESDLQQFGDILVALGNDGASTESAILDMTARFGSAGRAAGLSSEQILALASSTASMGIEAEAGGGALSRIFQNLTVDMATASEEGQLLASSLDMSLADLRAAWDKDAGAVFGDLLNYISELDQFEAAQFLTDLGITNTRDINAIRNLSQNVEEYNRQLGVAEGATDELNRESDVFFNTFTGLWKRFQNNVVDGAAVIGTELLPVFKELTEDAIDWLNDPSTQRGIKDFAENLAGGIRDVVEEIRNADLTPLIETLKGAAGFAKGAFDAFMALPADLRNLLLGFIAVNKVTGGALSDIVKGVGNLAGGGLKIALQMRGQTPANPLFVSDVSGGLGGGKGGPVGGKGGGKFPLLGVGSALAIPLMLSGSDNPTAQQFADQKKVERGEMTREEYDQLWNHGAVAQDIKALAGKGPSGTTGTSEWARGLEGVKQTLDTGTSAWAAGLNSLKSEVAMLPDTSMLAPAVNALTQNLPPIRSKADATLAAQYQALQAARSTTSEVGRLANTPHNVNVDNNITIPVHVSATLIQNQLYRLRTTTGSGGFI